MEVSIVLESNEASRNQLKVNLDKPMILYNDNPIKNSFLTVKIYEYFRNKIRSKGYSKEQLNAIMIAIEECIPKDNLSGFVKGDNMDVRLDILVREISMKADNRGITIDEKNLKEYLKQVYNENKQWF